MGVEREVFGLEEFGSLGVGRIFEQDRAKDGLFRVDVGGQAGFEGEVGDGGHRSRDRNASVSVRGRSSEFDWFGGEDQAKLGQD